MKRRKFIFTSTVGGLAGVPILTACQSKSTSMDAEKKEYNSMPEYTVSQVHELYQNGELNPVELVELYLKRIREIDQAGPSLRSIIEINPDAVQEAIRCSEELKSGKFLGALHGIPVLLKDNIDTGDKMKTTAGSLALADSIAPSDAFIVKKLREAGAILLGKTNLSEWANFRSTRSSSGWSGRGGQTRNPYILDRNPCGSSSGSGVAMSANLGLLAIGTETDGSIVCPSSTNGIVGIKPTVGLWSRSGIIPISHTQDTAGPMARSVEDCAILLGVLGRKDPEDKATSFCPFPDGHDFTQYLNKDALQGARIGVDRSNFGFHPGVDRCMEESLKRMKEAGAAIIDPASLNLPKEVGEAEWEVLLYEFKDGLNRYLSGLPETFKIRSLSDLIRFNEENRDKEMPWFGQEIFILAEAKGGLEETTYQQALKKSLSLSRAAVDDVLKKYSLDAIVAPTGGPAWTTDWINGDHFIGGSSTACACAGYPAITVPAGMIQGLPVGITFMQTAWQEPRLLSLAYAFEQLTQFREVPGFKPSLTNV